MNLEKSTKIIRLHAALLFMALLLVPGTAHPAESVPKVNINSTDEVITTDISNEKKPGAAGNPTPARSGPRQELSEWEQAIREMPTFEQNGELCRYTNSPILAQLNRINGGSGDGRIPVRCTPIQETAAREAAVTAGREAATRLTADAGTVKSSPPAGKTVLVGRETYFWVEGTGQLTKSVQQDGFDLGIKADPANYIWDFGDSTTLRGNAGTPGEQTSEINHIYNQPGTYTVTARITWEISFTSDGNLVVPPEQVETATTLTLPVSEIRGLLVN